MSVTFGQWVCVTLEVAFIQALILGLVACAYDGLGETGSWVWHRA